MSCECNLVGNFGKDLEGYGIISAVLRANTNFEIADNGTLLMGPCMGDFAITAYAPMTTSEKARYTCSGRAGISVGWTQKLSCTLGLNVYFLPNGVSKSYIEGSVPIGTTFKWYGGYEVKTYDTYEANASSGPTTPVLVFEHTDGYNLIYNGNPIVVDATCRSHAMSYSSVKIFSDIMPKGASLYLTSFSWSHDPPNIPVVNYSFIFVYHGRLDSESTFG